MNRREFSTLLGGAAAAWPLAARAQQLPKVPTIGFLGAESASTNQHFFDAFRQGMREHGYIDGKNLTFVERWAEGRSERFPELIGELLSLKVNVILAVSVAAALAAKHGTATIPPNASRVAVLWNPTNPASSHYMTVLRGAAEKLGIVLQLQSVTDPDQFDRAFAAIVAARAQALVVVVDPLTVRYRGRIVALATTNRLPAMYGFREFVDAGGLISYGVNVPFLCRRAAVYVDKIIKGATPAELPVEQPTRFELVINLKTATALGLEVPPTMLVRADEVIE